jgi:uncharacterized protein (DUF342 family)
MNNEITDTLDSLVHSINRQNELIQKLEDRIIALEEKEKERDRDEWQRELALDSGPPDYIPLGDD